MKIRPFYKILCTTTVFILLLSSSLLAQEKKNQFYNLKIYSYSSPENEQQIDAYLKDAYLPALKRLAISPVGVFKPKDQTKDTLMHTYVLVPMTSLDEAYTLDEKLSHDAAYKADGKAYLEASYDHAPYARLESILLMAFDEMPIMKAPTLTGPRKDRVYELRSYESPTEALHKNKVAMFNKGGEVKLFKDLDFNAVFYSRVIYGSHMPNLMYMTTFDNIESREAHWKAFGKSPVWKKLSSLPEYQNNVSHIDIIFLYPTSYSDY
jgi:hypothetical protein